MAVCSSTDGGRSIERMLDQLGGVTLLLRTHDNIVMPVHSHEKRSNDTDILFSALMSDRPPYSTDW